MRLPHSIRLAALGCAVLATLPARADAVQPPAEPARQPGQQGASSAARQDEPMQRVEIKGSAAAYDPRRDDTASKVVVSDEEIKRYGDTSVTDVFKRIPGVTVGGAGRGGNDIRMRGLDSVARTAQPSAANRME